MSDTRSWFAPVSEVLKVDDFTVDVETDADSVRVTFTSATHESRIDADWEDGAPRVRVREEAED